MPAKATGGFTTGHAVVIGVANYRHGSPLPGAVLNDAQDIAAVLKAHEYCGYDERNVQLLLDGDATLERIRAALASVAGASGPDDTVVIFFSGHGANLGDPADPESALLPVECDPRTLDTTSLSEPEFSAALQRVRRTATACPDRRLPLRRSREASRQLKWHSYRLSAIARSRWDAWPKAPGAYLIASSRASEESLVFSSARNSVFTSHLLERLARPVAWTRGDGLIRVFEIFNHVSEMVKRQVPGRQHPVFKASDLEDNFPVALNRGGVKSTPSPPVSAADPDIWNQLGQIMPDLYPAGPMDQEIWARAGGDPSRLHLNETGQRCLVQSLGYAPPRWRWIEHSPRNPDSSRA